MLLSGLVMTATASFANAQSTKLIPVTFTLNWLPSPDHAGYYAAKVNGIYERHGLDVTIKPGGPQLNIHQLLAAGQTDMIMSTTMRTLNARRQGIPIVTVAAWYQRDAQTLMLHPENQAKSLADLNRNPMFMPGISLTNYWPWLKAKYGFSDEQLKPYDFSFRTWSLDPKAASQGYITVDAANMAKANVPDGRSLLLADFGWNQYINTVDTTDQMVSKQPEVIRAFLRATAEGWRRYLADPASANAEINKLNPQLDAAALNSAYDIIRNFKLVEGGDAAAGKIGTINGARIEKFINEMNEIGALPASPDYQKSYTTIFMDAL
jgi:NitT/TauT family transport system substrate-binding protein